MIQNSSKTELEMTQNSSDLLGLNSNTKFPPGRLYWVFNKKNRIKSH